MGGQLIMDFYEALKKLYVPQFGSIWKAPNRIWTSGFARGANGEHIHPSIVEKIYKDNVTVTLVPGTSKDYQRGSCVWKADLSVNSRKTYFLLKLSMPYHIDDLKDNERGWDGIDELDNEQKSDFNRQIKFCRG